MPVLAQPPYEQWLDGPPQNTDALAEHLGTHLSELKFFPVSTRVGSYKNDDPGLITPPSQALA